ncbi:MAG: TylF/MycF/NovP-related O-methyltransferase [Stappiaceae bacterium]
MSLKNQLKTFCAKFGIWRRDLFGRWPYMYTPLQVAKLVDLAAKTRDIPGSYVEVGCAYGASTVLLMKTFDEIGVVRQGYALDTFDGFVDSQANYDIETLGKNPSLRKFFKNNDESWMRSSLDVSRIDNVEVIQMDATKFDYQKCGPIAFALLDVDLYQPINDILPKLYDQLSNGGIIVVDDCVPDHPYWEGALIAYREFVSKIGAPEEIVAGKLGLVRKSQ